MRRVAGFVAIWILSIGVPLAAAAPRDQTTAAVSVFTQSQALETANDLAGARRAIVDAFGVLPDDYDACMRLGWLSLRQHDSASAIRLYRHARSLPDAREGAGEGLVTALTSGGFDALKSGDHATARRDWEEAIAIDRNAADARRGLVLIGASHAAGVETWVGQLGGKSDSAAKLFYLHVPVRVSNNVKLRIAFRQIGGASPAATATVMPFLAASARCTRA